MGIVVYVEDIDGVVERVREDVALKRVHDGVSQ